jgi:hypothetical protein
MIQHITNTLYNVYILKYIWFFMTYIHNLFFELHSIVSNEVAFNLLCGEILPSSAHIRSKNSFSIISLLKSIWHKKKAVDIGPIS